MRAWAGPGSEGLNRSHLNDTGRCRNDRSSTGRQWEYILQQIQYKYSKKAQHTAELHQQKHQKQEEVKPSDDLKSSTIFP